MYKENLMHLKMIVHIEIMIYSKTFQCYNHNHIKISEFAVNSPRYFKAF